MSLTLTLVDEGRAAFAKSSQDGTNAFTITRAVLGTTFYAFDSTRTEVVSQCDEATAGAIGSSSDEESGIISVALTFSGSEAYSAYELYVYATYDNDSDDHAAGDEFCLAACVSDSESEPIITKAASSRAIIYAYMLITDGDITDLTISNTELVVPAASQTIAGIVRMATEDETAAGLDALIAVSPATLASAVSSMIAGGTALQAYDADTTYSAGDIVYVVSDNELRFAFSLQNDNTGNEVTDTTWWLLSAASTTSHTYAYDVTIESVDLTETDGVLSGTITLSYTDSSGTACVETITIASATVDEDGNLSDIVFGDDETDSIFDTYSLTSATWSEDSGLSGYLSAASESGYYVLTATITDSAGTGTLYYTSVIDVETKIAYLETLINAQQGEIEKLQAQLSSSSSSSSSDDDSDSDSSADYDASSLGFSGTPSSLGTAGGEAFGVGPCDDETAAASLGLSAMDGTDDIHSDNYGNYQRDDGSIAVWYPAGYVRVGSSKSDVYTTKGDKAIDIISAEDYAALDDDDKADFWLFPAFYNAGSIQTGFFRMKYQGYYDSSAGVMIHSRDYDCSTTSELGGNYRVIDYNRSYSGWNQQSYLMQLWVELLAICHAQHATSSTYCAWYDSAGTDNHPRKYNDDGTYSTSSWRVYRANITDTMYLLNSHNGQACGGMDMGNLWDIGIGVCYPGTASTDTTVAAMTTSDTFYLLSPDQDVANITSDYGYTSGVHNHFGTAANLLASGFEAFTCPVSGSGWKYILPDTVWWPDLATTANRRTFGLWPKSDSVYTTTRTSGDADLDYSGHYLYSRNNLTLLMGGYSYTSANALGVFARYWNYYRTYAYTSVAARAGAYLPAA